MAVSITIRNVPDGVRDVLAARAARSGRSLQEHLLAHLVEIARKPSVDEVLSRAGRRAATTGTALAAEEILAYRDADRA